MKVWLDSQPSLYRDLIGHRELNAKLISKISTITDIWKMII
jgi:hypothetical protein